MLPRGLAPLLVFVASGAVLVLEILGVRLLAPYVGLTLETYTTIIGVVLAGIAIGAAAGGRAADRVPPRPLLALLLAGGGLLALLTVPLVRVLGEAFDGAGTASAMALALFALLPPATVLSAVTPVVVKLELGDLAASGTVVGRLSGWATAGALAGTFATGFVLVPLLPVSATVIGIGALLVLAGLAVGLLFRALPGGTVLAVAGAAALLAAVAALSGSRCQTESVYFCANVVADPDRPAGRTLMLDDLRHSYVDLRDPRHLEFAYTRWMGDAIDAMRPPGEPLDAVFVGGGGFTLPRYLAATRPGSRSRVLEVDQQLVELARAELGLRTGPDLRVEVGDARVTLRGEPGGSADLVVGDAFGGRSVPWHLATREFAADIRRVLRPDGIYLLNVIDFGDLDLVRAEAATLLDVFADVRLVARPGPAGGNLVLIASARPLPAAVGSEARGARTLDRAAVRRFAGDAAVLTDDDAPADQLLTAGT
ncbi:MAG: fused MFS/spermidine synthase [Solirubrobacteraceae bacterium]